MGNIIAQKFYFVKGEMGGMMYRFRRGFKSRADTQVRPYIVTGLECARIGQAY